MASAATAAPAARRAAEAAVQSCDAAALRAALARAAGSGHDGAGVDAGPDTARPDGDLARRRTYGFTLLHAACSLPDVGEEAAQVAVVQALLENGADLDGADPALGYTALHWASATAGPDLVRFLLDRGADAGRETLRNQSSVDLALERRKIRVVHVLLQRQGDREVCRVLRANLGPLAPVRVLEPGRRYASRKWRDRFVGLDKVVDAISVWQDTQAGALEAHAFASAVHCIRVQMRAQGAARVDLHHAVDGARTARLSLLFPLTDAARHFAGQCRRMALAHHTFAAASIQALWRGARARQVWARTRSRLDQATRLVANLGRTATDAPARQNSQPSATLARHCSAPQHAPIVRSPSLGLGRLKSLSRMRRMVSFGSSSRHDSEASQAEDSDASTSGRQTPLRSAMNHATLAADLAPSFAEADDCGDSGDDVDDETRDGDGSGAARRLADGDDASRSSHCDDDHVSSGASIRAVLRMRARRPSSMRSRVAANLAMKRTLKARFVEANLAWGGLAYWNGPVPLDRGLARRFIPFERLLDVRLLPSGEKSPSQGTECTFVLRTVDGEEAMQFVASSRQEAESWVVFLRAVLPRENLAALIIQTHARMLLAKRRTATLRTVRQRAHSHRPPPPVPEPALASSLVPCEVWESALDATTGRVYLFNGPDRRATWAPKEWVKSFDPKRQCYFYFNTIAHTSQWTPPLVAPRAIESAAHAEHLGVLLEVRVPTLEAFAEMVLQDQTLIIRLAQRVLPGLVYDDVQDESQARGLGALRLAAWAASMYGSAVPPPSVLGFNVASVVRVCSALLHVHNVRIIEAYLRLPFAERQLDVFVKHAVQAPRGDTSLLRTIHAHLCGDVAFRWADMARFLEEAGCRVYPTRLEMVQSQRYSARVAVCAWILAAKHPALLRAQTSRKGASLGRQDEMHALRGWMNTLDKFRLSQLSDFAPVRDEDAAILTRVCGSMFGAMGSDVGSRQEVLDVLMEKNLWSKQSFPSPAPSTAFRLPTLWALLDADARSPDGPEDPVLIRWANSRLPAAANVVSFEDPVHKTGLPAYHLAAACCDAAAAEMPVKKAKVTASMSSREAAALALSAAAQAGCFIPVPAKLLATGNAFAVHVVFVFLYLHAHRQT